MVFPALLRDSEGLHLQFPVDRREAVGRHRDVRIDRAAVLPALARQLAGQIVELSSALPHLLLDPRRRRGPARLVRSEERRVGKECVSTCRSGWSPYHSKKKKQ